jgi:hypothetical protein
MAGDRGDLELGMLSEEGAYELEHRAVLGLSWDYGCQPLLVRYLSPVRLSTIARAMLGFSATMSTCMKEAFWSEPFGGGKSKDV